MADHIAIIPSQVVHPWKAAIRTFLQVLVPAVLLILTVGPEVLQIIAEQLKGQVPDGFIAWLLAAAGLLAAIAGAAARIMAIPQVNAALGRIRLDAGSATLTK
ncbi:membrane protein [Arthrobacter phage EvePickles]|nr:membrane protein [Arthrobacter phage EvePickles]